MAKQWMRRSVSACRLDWLIVTSLVVVLMGAACSNLANEENASRKQAFLVVENGWNPTGGMLEARTNHTATLLNSGEVLVTGGDDIAVGFVFLGAKATAEIYDPVTGSFFSTGSMTTKRTVHSATVPYLEFPPNKRGVYPN